MEKVLDQSTYHIPFSRYVKLSIADYNPVSPVLVRIIKPKNFEDIKLTAELKTGGVFVMIPDRFGKRMLRPTDVDLVVYRVVEDKAFVPPPVVENPNPVPDPIPEKETFIQKITSINIMPKDRKSMAIEETLKRKARLKKITEEVDQSSALKPAGQDGKRILTGDDCDYSRGMALIEILQRLEDKNNDKDGLVNNQRKLLCEFYDTISFSGIGVIIGLYVALGSKSRGGGSLSFLSNWYKTELSKIFTPPPLANARIIGGKIAGGMKFKQFRKKPNPGKSIKYAEKVISWLFTDKDTGEPLRAKHLQCEIYQPIFFDDEQTRAYSMGATPIAKLSDIVVNTGLDPLYFQSKNVEIGISAGPARRSFDLPFAQHNQNIKLTSIGCQLLYQESEPNMQGLNEAQVAFINRSKSRRVEHLDTEKYMKDHPRDVSYLRIEAGRCNGVMANSILASDLDECKRSVDRVKAWSNQSQSLIEWS